MEAKKEKRTKNFGVIESYSPTFCYIPNIGVMDEKKSLTGNKQAT